LAVAVAEEEEEEEEKEEDEEEDRVNLHSPTSGATFNTRTVRNTRSTRSDRRKLKFTALPAKSTIELITTNPSSRFQDTLQYVAAEVETESKV
jgi:hypothetical protein